MRLKIGALLLYFMLYVKHVMQAVMKRKWECSKNMGQSVKWQIELLGLSEGWLDIGRCTLGEITISDNAVAVEVPDKPACTVSIVS